MIIGIEGSIGQGKTLTMVFLALQEYKEHRKRIFANFHLKGVPYEYITFEDFIKWSRNCEACKLVDVELCSVCGSRSFKRSVILVDEAHIWMDSRTSASKMNRLQTYLMLQTGKEGINLYYTTQSFRQVDIRLRQRTDIFLFVRKKVVNGEPSHLVKMEDVTRPPGTYPRRLVIPAKEVWDFYDTEEVVHLPEALSKRERERSSSQ